MLLKSILIITILHTLFCIAFFVAILNILQSSFSAKTRFDQSTEESVSWLTLTHYTLAFYKLSYLL